MKRTSLILIVFSLVFFTSCHKDKTPNPEGCGNVVSYSVDIRPIIETSCKTQQGPNTGCHDAWIDDYQTITAYVENGSWENETVSLKTMPLFPESNAFGIDSLTEDEIISMRCWLNQGYPDN